MPVLKIFLSDTAIDLDGSSQPFDWGRFALVEYPQTYWVTAAMLATISVWLLLSKPPAPKPQNSPEDTLHTLIQQYLF
jgi:hypothetical protein